MVDFELVDEGGRLVTVELDGVRCVSALAPEQDQRKQQIAKISKQTSRGILALSPEPVRLRRLQLRDDGTYAAEVVLPDGTDLSTHLRSKGLVLDEDDLEEWEHSVRRYEERAAGRVTAFFLALFYQNVSCSGQCTVPARQESVTQDSPLSGDLLATASVGLSKLSVDVQTAVGRTRSGVVSGLSWAQGAEMLRVTVPLEPPMSCFMYTFDLYTTDGLRVEYDPVQRQAGEFTFRLPAARTSRQIVSGDLGVQYLQFLPSGDVATLELTSGASANAASVSVRSLDDPLSPRTLWTVPPGTIPGVAAAVAEQESRLWVSVDQGHAALALDATLANLLFLPAGTARSCSYEPLCMLSDGRLLCLDPGSHTAQLLGPAGPAVELGPVPTPSDVPQDPTRGQQAILGDVLYDLSSGTASASQLPPLASVPGVFENPRARCASYVSGGDGEALVVLYEDATAAWWRVVVYDARTLQLRYSLGAEQRFAALQGVGRVTLGAWDLGRRGVVATVEDLVTGVTVVLRQGSHEPQLVPPLVPGAPQRAIDDGFGGTPLLVLDRDTVVRSSFDGYYWVAVSTAS